MIYIAKPMTGKEEIKAAEDVIKSGMLAQGAMVKEFEAKFAEYIGVKHAIATSSGTTALHLALLGAGIGAGDEVITTPFTFIATGTSIQFTGATPVFVDIDSETYNIDPKRIESAITAKTKAIMPVHLYGLPANMDEIMEIAEKNNLKVIEDACQAHGSMIGSKKSGSIGDAGGFSFYPTKNMTTGEGGMVTTNDDDIAESVRLRREHGMKSRYEYVSLGYNFRMTDIEASIGIQQLKKLDDFNSARQKNARKLNELIDDEVGKPFVPENYTHVYHQYTIRVSDREKLIESLKKNEVGFGIYYPKSLVEIPVLKSRSMQCPETSRATMEVVSLPVHPGLSEEDLVKIADAVNGGI